MAKSILIFIVLLFTSNIALSKRVMLDSYELKIIKEFYYSTDTILWYRDDLSKLYIGKIYQNKDYIHSNIPKVRVVYDRDTIINTEEIEICKFQVLNFEEMIVSPNSYDAWQTLWDGKFISGTFTKLEELKLSGCYNLNNDEPFYAPNLRIFKCYENQLSSTIDLNAFPNLEELDFYKVNNNFDLTNLNLPKCKIFKVIGSELSTSLNIINMNNVEVFQIRDEYYPIFSEQGQFSMSLQGTDINKLLKDLKNVRILSLAHTFIDGEIAELDMPNLEFLELYLNLFTGKFPILLTPKLEYLSIGSTAFSAISDTIRLEKLKYFDFSNSNISSKLPIFIMDNLEHIDLNGSNFSGNLDTRIFKNSSLKYVDFSHNDLEGDINFNIYSDNLVCLNLASNKFSGKMPNVVAPHLSYLNLAGNQFNKLFDSLNVYQRTFVKINGNKLPPSEIALFCENAINEGKLSNYIYPNYILEYSKHIEFDSIYSLYSGTDVFQQIVYNNIEQKDTLFTIFNENTNHLEIEDLDTNIFTYSILKYVDNVWVESGLSIWDYIPEIGIYKVVAKSKICDFTYDYPVVKITKLSVESLIVDCKKIIPIDYYDLLGNKLNPTDIYNKQVIVRYKCLETGEIFHKLEIRDAN